MAKLKKLSLLSFAMLVHLIGCSYTGYLHKGFHESSKPVSTKINQSAALVNTQELQDLRFQEYTGGYTFTFYINPAYNEELIKELKNVFSDVQIIATTRDLEKFNMQVIPEINLQYISGSSWGGQYKYKIITDVTIKDAKLNNTIETFKDTQDLVFSPTPGSIFLNVLTGLSLFILSPITIPIGTEISGDNAMSIIEEGLGRSIKSISYQISNSPKIYRYKN